MSMVLRHVHDPSAVLTSADLATGLGQTRCPLSYGAPTPLGLRNRLATFHRLGADFQRPIATTPTLTCPPQCQSPRVSVKQARKPITGAQGSAAVTTSSRACTDRPPLANGGESSRAER